MVEHKCYIGVLSDIDKTVLATVEDLEQIIEARLRYNELAEKEGLPTRRVAWTLEDYCYRRKSTDLNRFIFCPECGKKIDWKRLKEGK